MFSKLAVVATAAFALLAAAVPVDPAQGQCSTGTQACCDSVQDSSTPQALQALGAIGAQIGAGIPVGLTCTPVSVAAIGGNSCSQQPVCCNKDTFNGIVAIGCTPINAVL